MGKSVWIALLFAGAGLILMGAGMGIYLAFRPAHTASGLSAIGLSSTPFISLPEQWRWINALPSLLHVAAFTFFSYACTVPSSRGVAASIALAWAATNVLFELGQALKPPIPISVVLNEYLRNGTFDPFDLIASCLGGLLAFSVAERVLKWRK